jgi:hypothetical protein
MARATIPLSLLAWLLGVSFVALILFLAFYFGIR